MTPYILHGIAAVLWILSGFCVAIFGSFSTHPGKAGAGSAAVCTGTVLALIAFTLQVIA